MRNSPEAAFVSAGRSQGLDIGLAIATGAVAGVAIVGATAASAKAFVVVMGLLLAGAVWMLLAQAPGVVFAAGWTALAATLSLSVKYHPVFRADHLGGAIGIRISITELLLVALVMLGWLGGWRLRGAVIRFPPLVAAAAGAYLACAVLSTLVSDDRALGGFQVLATIQALVVGAVFCNLPRAAVIRRVVVTGLLLGLCAQGAVALAQAWRPGAVSLPALGVLTDTQAETIDERLPDVDLGSTTIGGDVTVRPTGLLIHPNVLGAYLVLTLPLAVGVWLVAATRTELALASVAVVLGGIALYVSLSRSAWLGMTMAGGVMALAAWRAGFTYVSRRRIAVLALAVVVAVGALAARAERIYLRLTESASDAVDFRSDLNAMAWRMATTHPLTGVGLNTFIYAAPRFDETGQSRLKAFPAHNAYMLELAESGIPGGLSFAALVAASLWTMRRASARATNGPEQLLAIAIASGLAGFWLTQTVDYVYRIPVLTTIVWAYSGLALHLATREETP